MNQVHLEMCSSAEWAETELKAARLLTAAGTDLAGVRRVALTGANQ